MPGFDKTGREGEGAMTGRRMRRCIGYGARLQKSMQSENPDDFPENYGHRSRGRGFGFQNRFRGVDGFFEPEFTRLCRIKTNITAKTMMNRKVAIPLENGILCTHFGHCRQFAIIETENDNILNEILITPPPHEPGVLPAWLAEKGVTDVIAGGMGQRAIALFNQQKINVFVGAQQKPPQDLTKDLINNALIAGANYCDH